MSITPILTADSILVAGQLRGSKRKANLRERFSEDCHRGIEE